MERWNEAVTNSENMSELDARKVTPILGNDKITPSMGKEITHHHPIYGGKWSLKLPWWLDCDLLDMYQRTTMNSQGEYQSIMHR